MGLATGCSVPGGPVVPLLQLMVALALPAAVPSGPPAPMWKSSSEPFGALKTKRETVAVESAQSPVSTTSTSSLIRFY